MSTGLEIDKIAAELHLLELKRQSAPLSESESTRRRDLLLDLMNKLQRSPGSERRQYLRIPAELEARFRMGEATITCHASELSYGGIGLKGHLWIIEDQVLIVENLRLGNRDYPMAIRARVVWKISDEDNRPGAGLTFIDVDEEGKRQIAAVFERLFMAYLERLAATGG
jgi:hypothetical protein